MTLPSLLPSYTMLNTKSHWHSSALFAAAFESMTLPSRLKPRDGSRETIDELASSLNINGNQNIARLQMSIDQQELPNGHHDEGALDPHSQNGDTRTPFHERRADNGAPDTSEAKNLDMNFFAFESSDYRSRRDTKTIHVFRQAEYHRSDEEPGTVESIMDAGRERARRRAAGLTIIQKYVTTLLLLCRISWIARILQVPSSLHMLEHCMC